MNGACAHYVMVSKFQWKPFWLATQRDPQNDWTATQNRVNYDVFAQAPLHFYSAEVPPPNNFKLSAFKGIMLIRSKCTVDVHGDM